MATFSITTETQKRRHTMFGKVIGRRVSGTRFFLWYLPSGGNQFTRAVGGPYDTMIEARAAARNYAARKLGTQSVSFVRMG